MKRGCLILLLCAALARAAIGADAAVEIPTAVDERLVVELFAAEPDIVTPAGIAVDDQGRVLVIESHTHFRPPNYQGPPADRIRMFVDTDGDGRADRITTFFEGTRSTMNVALDRQGRLYVATRNEIFRLRDTDGDGQADERTQLVRMETEATYPHNALSGFAFDHADNMYFGMGENWGVAYKLIGSDGSSDSSIEGGHVFRATADGAKLERLATGFWNPFHLAFDPFERLFVVDNDPDALPPCRLLDVVAGGNYGYKWRNGRRGLHPFTAWNGELPGTLPMVAGTGEAPSGIVCYQAGALPADYAGDLLVTSWGDHRLERFRPEPRGASFRARAKTFVSGGENFRPVGIAVAPDGSLLVSDWVDKSYEVHGKGRLWRVRPAKPRQQPPTLSSVVTGSDPGRSAFVRKLAADKGNGPGLLSAMVVSDKQQPETRAAAIEALAAAGNFAPLAESLAKDVLPPELEQLVVKVLPAGAAIPERLLDPAAPPEVRAAALRRVDRREFLPQAWAACADRDPFIAQAGRRALGNLKVIDANFDVSALKPVDRLAALLVLRETDQPPGQLLRRSLSDPNPDVRFVALQWVGEEHLADYRADVERVLSAGPASSLLFAAYLATLEKLDTAARKPGDEWAGEQYVARALEDSKTPSAVRCWALRTLRPDHPLLKVAFLRRLIEGSDAELEREAIRTLRARPAAESGKLLRALAADAGLAAPLRAEAVVGILPETAADRELLLSLAVGQTPLAAADAALLRHEALRSLRGAALDERQRAELKTLQDKDADTAELVARVLDPEHQPARPSAQDLDAWLALLEGPASADEGGRIFFHARSAGCFRCHAMDGRGGTLGPSLSTAGQALERRRLVDSILRPSQEVAPHFVTWNIETTDGQVKSGMLVRELADGVQVYADQQAQEFLLRPEEIAERKLQNRSLMPDGLERLLTLGEFRNLLAYLQPGEAKSAGEQSAP